MCVLVDLVFGVVPPDETTHSQHGIVAQCRLFHACARLELHDGGKGMSGIK